tara:strand:- start:48 stop:422 length:375 start_codon:yes stop_codon:yes gene_type:complete
MKDSRTLYAQADALQDLLEQTFRFKSRDLAQALRKTGRRLPARHRRQVAAVVEAQALATHPKLAVQVDAKPLMKGLGEVTAYVGALDVEGQRRDRLLNMAALVAFYVLIVLTAFIFFLWWRGYV